MATSGASSYGGSGGSSRSSFVHKRERPGVEQDHEQGDNLLDRRSSLEYGTFGVLFTLSKEKSEHRIRIRWVLLKLLLDGWQLFTTVIAPERQAWNIDPDGTAWTVIGVLNFTWLGKLGYGAYLAVLYSMLALLTINIAMCVWVAWCFKEHKFPVVWPIKVLRVFSSVFFQAFDVASLNLLQLGITCRFTGPTRPDRPKLHFDLFGEYSCMAPPHIMHAVVSALCLILFVFIALLLNMAEVEVNPLSRRPMALGHSGAEVMAFGIKVLMTMVSVFIGWQWVEASIYLSLSLALAWQTFRWSPNLVSWVNYMKLGVSTMVVWCSAMLLLLLRHPGIDSTDTKMMHEWSKIMTATMLAGIAPAFGVGALISWINLRHLRAAALKGLENPKKLPLVEVFTSIDEPRDVEIAARYCRTWKEPAVLDPDAITKAHQIIKAGLEMFPSSSFMVLLHANFMIDVLGISQSGSRRIEDARKLNPSLMCRFIMFVRQQQATQHAAGSSVSATMDLLGYVEYQRKQRMVVRLHREALQAMCNFWKALDASTVSFTHLSKSLAKIETSVSQAQRAYRVVLESYGNNPKLVHLYGRFLQTIKNDPWHAAEYFAEAERLEELQDSNAGGPLMPDGTPLSRMDEIDTSVLVLNAVGEVQMANRHTQYLFGYKRGVLEGKPLLTLLAPHYARRLSERLASIATAHELLGIGQPEDNSDLAEEMVVGLHADRLAFPAKLSLRKASGVGEDSTIIALVEPVPPIPGMCSVWVTQNGIITACDPSFVANFGWKANEVNGTSIKGLVMFPLLPPTKAPGVDTGSVTTGQQRVSFIKTARPNASASEIIKRLLSEAVAPAAEADALSDVDGTYLTLGNIHERNNPQTGGGVPALVPHKYIRKPLACTLSIVPSAATDSPIVHEIRIKMDTDPVQLLAVNRKGAILHASTELAARLKDRSHARLGSLMGLGGNDHGQPHPHDGAVPATAGGDAMMGTDHTFTSSAGLNGYTLFDFLSPAWKDMHLKLLKEITTVSPLPVSELCCRKSADAGPTLELRTAGGRSIYMRVGAATTEVQGEVVHIVHMARSSLEEALAERRLRLKVSPDGLIAAVEAGNPSQLFGLEASKLVGRGLWEILEEPALPQGAAAPQMTVRGSNSTIIMRDAASLIKRAVKYPGHSWRVQVVPPPSRGVRVSFTQQAKPAVMQVHVILPSDEDEQGDPSVQVDLWPVSTIVGVLDLDQYGRVRGLLEEPTRPAGLLFGVPTQSLMGGQLAEFLALPPGRTKPTDLLFMHATKKSSLKAQAKEASVKVGPVHVLRATHRDGRPLTLDVQIIGKPGSSEPSIAILKIHQVPMVPLVLKEQQQQQPQTQQLTTQQLATQQRHPQHPTAVAISPLPARLMSIPPQPPATGTGPATVGGDAGTDKKQITPATTSMMMTANTTMITPGATLTLPKIDPATITSKVDDTVLTMFDNANNASNAGGLANLQQQQLLMPISAMGTVPPPGVISPQRTPSPEDTKRRPSSPWRTPGATNQPPPVIRSLSTPPAAKPLLVSGGSAFIAGSAPVTGTDLAVESLSSPPLEGADLHQGMDVTFGARQQLSGRNKLAEMVKAVGEVDRSGSMSGRQVPPPSARIGSRAGTGVRLRSPVLFRKGTGSSRAPAGSSVHPEDVGDADDGETVDDGDAEASDGGASVTEGRRAKANARVLEWVNSKGAFFQNSIPEGGTKAGIEAWNRFPSICKDMYDDNEGEAANRGEDFSPRAGIVVERFPTSPMNDSASRPHPEFPKGRFGLGSPGMDGMSPSGGFEEEDAGSDGGQSAVSGAQSATGSEYTRGKRFRKLAKLMDSNQTQLVQKRLRYHALILVTLLAVVHIICFILTVSAIKQQKASMLQLGRSGQAQLYMHRIMIDTRSLDIISHNKALPNLFTAVNDTGFVKRIASDAEEVKVRFNEILNTHSNSPEIISLLYLTKRRVWDTNDADGTDIYANLTIWDFATRFYSMAKQVEQLYDQWKLDKAYVADTYPGQFLLKSGPDLFIDSRKILDALLYKAVNNARRVDVLQIVFLITEGAAISFLAACYLTFLLRAVAAQRFKLYSTFLVIPVGLTRALASQNLNLLLDDDEDEDGDDEEDRPAPATTTQDTEDGSATPKLRRRATLKVDEEQQPESTGNGSPGWTQAGRRLSARRNSENDVSLRNSGADDDVGRKPFMDRYDKYDKQRTLTAELTVPVEGRHTGWCCGRFGLISRLRNLLLGRRGSILPLPITNSISKLVQHQGGLGGSSSKRSLKFDSHETVIMLLPFIVWSAMVITIYAVAVVQMQGVDEVVAVHSVVNFMSARTSRTVFFCQELANVDEPSQLMEKRAALLRVVKLVRDAWYTLQLGDKAYTALGAGTERFPLVRSGLSHASKQLQDLFYSSGVCHRREENLPCPDNTYRFFQVTHTGLDSMMQQFMISLSSMATNSSMVPEGLEDEHFDFVYNVGYKDLLDGTTKIAEAHYNTILALFNSILLLHIILFLLFWFIFGGFLLFMLNPLLKRISHERRRIAELMSQLPLELDVERLVARALGTHQSTGHQPGQEGDRSTNQNMGAGGGSGSGNEREIEGAAHKWKAIIRASTSLTGKAPSMDGRKKP